MQCNHKRSFKNIKTLIFILNINRQLGPWVALGWVTISVLKVDAVCSKKFCKLPGAKKRGLQNISYQQYNILF